MAKKKKNDLGMGIRALLEGINTDAIEKTDEKSLSSTAEIAIKHIEVNPFQPRVDFDEDRLKELSQSIKIHGVVQPITVRAMGKDAYQLIAGERRLRASKLAGLKKIPAYIRTADDQAMLEIALIENIQREDLNPMEVAQNYYRLLEECALKHDELGTRLGKGRSTITNYLQLLKLPPEIQKGLKEKRISMGHARALVAVKEVDIQLSVYHDILHQGLSVRQVEAIVRDLNKGRKKSSSSSTNKLPAHLQKMQEELESLFGAKVNLKRNTQGKGQLVIAFASDDELTRILDILQ